MKKTFLIGIISLFSFLSSALAQQENKKLEGIWQFCEEVEKSDGEKVLACAPIWKIIRSDGKFSQFMLMYEDGACALTHEGTYDVKSSNKYVENIQSHAVDKALVGKQTVILYRFLNDDRVEFTFELPGRKDKFKEIWKRVKLYIPPKK